MSEFHTEAAGGGSSVDGDDDDAGNQHAGDETNTQGTSSSSVTCPNCGRQEVRDNEQSEEMQVTVDQRILKDLKQEVSEYRKHPAPDELLEVCIKKALVDPQKLLLFFRRLNDHHKTPARGAENSESSLVPDHKENSSSSSSSTLYLYTVKVFPHLTGQTCGAHNVILEKARSLTRTTNIQITDRQESDVIIVFCPVTTRAGSDVESAMRSVTGGKPVILVVMHHTRDVDFSTDAKRWSEDYKNVLLDVNVLFHETQQGLLKCPRNDQAFKKIQKELSKHSKYRWG